MATLIPVGVNPTGSGFAQATSGDTVSIPGTVALTALTQGSVVFAGAAGALSEDNDKLFFDATNFSLGVGTAAPGANTVSVAQPVKTTGSPVALLVTGGAHTTLTASVEAPDVYLNVTRTVQFATGALAAQRAVKIGQPTYGFVGGSTLTTAATVAVAGAPVKGTNATLTDTIALWIESASVGAAGTGHGMYVNAPTGATTNHGATIAGASGAGGTVLRVTETAPVATGAIHGIVYTGAVNTNQTLSTEIRSLTVTTAGRQWATGALAAQREVYFSQPTYSHVGGSTITTAATVAIGGAPAASTNATLTATHALLIEAAAVKPAGTVPASYGLTVNAMTGATANYAGAFLGGNVGIGSSTPLDALGVYAATTSVYRGQVSLFDTTAMALGVGAQIVFGGKYTGVGDYTEWCGIKGAKTNATDGQFGGNLVFRTRDNTGALRDVAIVNNLGNAGVGTAAPGTATRLAVRSESATHQLVALCRQASDTGALYLGNDASHNGIVAANGTDLLFGTDTAGTFYETMRVAYAASAVGKVAIATTSADYYLTINKSAVANGAGGLHVGSGIHTASTVGTEAPQVLLEGGGREWATGALAAQRAIKITAAAAYFVGGSTLTDAATVGITGAYMAGTNATITRSYGLWIESNAVLPTGVAVGSAYGLYVNAPTGATNNAAAYFKGATGAQSAVVVIEETTPSSGVTGALAVLGGAKTGVTATTEVAFVTLQPSSRQWATGAVAFQREVKISQPSYSFVGASVMTDGATFSVEGAPKAETNATITNSHGIYVRSYDVTGAGACDASYGLTVNAMSGATANYGAQFLGGDVAVVANNGTTPAIGIMLDMAPVGGGGLTLRDSHVLAFKSQSRTGGGVDHYGMIYLDGYAWNGTGESCFRVRCDVDSTTIGSADDMLVISYLVGTAGSVVLGDGNNPDDAWTLAPATKLTPSGYSGDHFYIHGGDTYSGSGKGGGNIFVDGGVGDATPGTVNIGTQIASEVINIGIASSTLGFYGGGPTAQQALAADPTAAEISTVLHNLGLVS